MIVFNFKKFIAIVGIGTTLIVLAKDAHKEEILVCVRWKWTGDVFERKVYCVQWEKKNCSNRLHKEICKLEGKKYD
jgi:hypothetical protein